MTGSDNQKEAGTGFYSGATSSDTSYGVSDPGEQMAASALQLQGQSPEDIAALRTQMEREMLTMASGPQQLTIGEMERYFPQAPDLARQVGERAMVQSGRDPNESESERDARVAREQAEAQRAAMAMMGGAGLGLAAGASGGSAGSDSDARGAEAQQARAGFLSGIQNTIRGATERVGEMTASIRERMFGTTSQKSGYDTAEVSFDGRPGTIDLETSLGQSVQLANQGAALAGIDISRGKGQGAQLA